MVNSEMFYCSVSDSELGARVLHDGLPLSSVSTCHFGVCVRYISLCVMLSISILFFLGFSEKRLFSTMNLY